MESPDDSPNARTNGIVAENNKPLTIHTANAEHSEAAIVSLQPAVVAEKKKTEEVRGFLASKQIYIINFAGAGR